MVTGAFFRIRIWRPSASALHSPCGLLAGGGVAWPAAVASANPRGAILSRLVGKQPYPFGVAWNRHAASSMTATVSCWRITCRASASMSSLEDVKDREILDSTADRIARARSGARSEKNGGRKGSKLIPRKDQRSLDPARSDVDRIPSSRHARCDGPSRIAAQLSRRGGRGALLGYVGEVSAEQLEKPEFAELHQGSIVGQYGVEKSFDRHMRGWPGQKSVEVDALGHEKRAVVVEQAACGGRPVSDDRCAAAKSGRRSAG